MVKNNPFTLAFGKDPIEGIDRIEEFNLIKDAFISDNVNSYIISGLRGTGKTVLMAQISDYFCSQSDWIHIDLLPTENLVESLVSKLYSEIKNKFSFKDKEFSFTFYGITFSLKGSKHIDTISSLIDEIFKILKSKNLKVLITIDETTSSNNMRNFILTFNSLIRKKHNIYLLMTGLYKNVSDLQNNENLTFLYRCPKIYLQPLNLIKIALKYEKILDINRELAIELSSLTKGYAFAFQLLGSIFYNSSEKKITKEILNEYDDKLNDYCYYKIFSDLKLNEKKLLFAILESKNKTRKDILSKLTYSSNSFSVYRDKLIKEGIIESKVYGELNFVLPRFDEFLVFQKMLNDVNM